MKWTELTIQTSSEGLETVTAVLSSAGISGFAVFDPALMLRELEESADTWDMVDEELVASLRESTPEVRLYVTDSPSGQRTVKNIGNILDSLRGADSEGRLGSLALSIGQVQDEDWEDNWKRYFKPFVSGDRLMVVPAWEEVPKTDRTVLLIDPASSFGSGMHETTRLCLKAIQDALTPGMAVLDVGSGSGILSAAAALLGAGNVTAVDIDENAVAATAATASLNGVSGKISVSQGDLSTGVTGEYDLVLANLFSNLIVRLAKDLRRVLKHGGLLLASGIIADGLGDVQRAMDENGLAVQDIVQDGDWYLVVAQLKDMMV